MESKRNEIKELAPNLTEYPVLSSLLDNNMQLNFVPYTLRAILDGVINRELIALTLNF